MLAPGDQVGRFVVIEQIGHGGMGDVYRARDPRLGREVAVKVLREREGEAAADPVGRKKQLLREAHAAVAFAHPNAVAVYEVGETAEGTAYIAMELVDGVKLREHVGDTAPLATRIRWLTDVARVLHAAHTRGLIHRDVKPENVMIRHDGVVKVLDFGLARRIDVDPDMSTTIRQLLSTITTEGHIAGSRAGTPMYMAPEQLRGEQVDRRTDQFSWGVMAYEVLSGELPWGRGNDQLQLLANLMSSEPRPLAERDPQIPLHVSMAVQRAMEKAPGHRFPAMADVLAALDGQDAAARVAAPVAGGTARAESADVAPTAPGAGVRARSRRMRFVVAMVSAVVVAGGTALRCLGGDTPAPKDHFEVLQPALQPSGPRCISHASCTAIRGAPSRCFPDVGCVALASDGCQVLAEPADLLDDATVFFGVVLPLGKDNVALAELHAMDLGRRDFATMMQGFHTDHQYGRTYPFALVACDETYGTERGVRHLVEDVRVPAIIGFSNGAELMRLAGSTLGPRGVLVIAPFTTSPLLRDLPRPPGSPRMVYRTTYDSAQTARALAAAIPAVFEPELRRGGGIVDRDHPLRVALVRQSATRLSAFASTFFRALQFNGKSALDNGEDYRELTYDEVAPNSPTAGYAAVRDALLEFRPHVVVYVGDDPMSERVVVATERAWTLARYRPRWLALGAITPSVLRFVGKDAARGHRFFGISEVTNAPPNARFVLHYNEVFDDKIARAGGPNTSYDAFYVLAYATYALNGGEPVTGRALAGAIRRLIPPGRPIDVGPAAIFEAFSALRAGESIDLNGATGSLDFDLDTGDAPIDQALLCISVDGEGRAIGSMESGVVHDARDQTLRGALHCP